MRHGVGEPTDVDESVESYEHGIETASAGSSPPLATPESRRACAQAALREALDLCATPDGKPDFVALAAAEGRYNATLARELMASIVTYARQPGPPYGGSMRNTRIAIGSDGVDFFEVPCARDDFPSGRTPLGTPDDVVAAVASHARNPCTTLGPFVRCDYAFEVPIYPEYTGRPTQVEAAMWCTWWSACVKGLTSTSGTDGPLDSVRPLDASFCASALVLARALLDMGTERVRGWAPKEILCLEEGMSDHVARHWARATYNGNLVNTSAPRGLARWYMARAVLVGFIGVMERVYNTHAIYDTLGVAKFESDIVKRSMPPHLFE